MHRLQRGRRRVDLRVAPSLVVAQHLDHLVGAVDPHHLAAQFGGAGLRVMAKVSVDMLAYDQSVIDEYLARNESMDKAGAYSIQGQGSQLIASIDGDFLAAVGMPLRPIADYLRRRHVEPPVDIERLYREKKFLNWRQFA